MKEKFKRESVKTFQITSISIRGGILITPQEKTNIRFSMDYRKFYLYTGGKCRLIGITDTILSYEKEWNYIFT